MKRLLNILLFSMSMFSVMLPAEAQVDKQDVRRGNRDFRKENFREAEIDYRKALVKDSLSVPANYNLAGTLYREGDMEQAVKVLDRIGDAAQASPYASDYYYNLGDVAIARQDWQGAVEAFSKSLLLNPGDVDAKQNFIYARMMLKNQQNQQNQQDRQGQDQNQEQQNQNQDQQDQSDDRQNDERNDQGQNEDKERQDRESGEQPKITPQAAQQMLQAIQAKEKETQDKVNRQKAEAMKARQKDRNW